MLSLNSLEPSNLQIVAGAETIFLYQQVRQVKKIQPIPNWDKIKFKDQGSSKIGQDLAIVYSDGDFLESSHVKLAKIQTQMPEGTYVK